MANELMIEFQRKFSEMKDKLGFSASFEELNDIFFLTDVISERKYVSDKLSRVVCRRIVDTYGSWLNYLHGLVVPNPNYMIGLAEAQHFSQDDKDEFIKLMDKIMAHISTNNLIGVSKDTKLEANFIDDSLKLWKEINPKLVDINKSVNTMWKNKVSEQK